MVFSLPSNTSVTHTTLVKQFGRSVKGLVLTTGFLLAIHAYLPAHSSETTSDASIPPASDALATNSDRTQPLADGIYLYGQAPERDQLGSAYMVFESNQGQVVGAFYMPHSSFDCFYGNFEADRLALTVIDSYEQTPHPYAVALEPADSLATTNPETAAPISLEGFHAIDSVTENDLRILATCRADQSQI